MLYAAEWPCCHDPLRLGLCFEDLSTHARAASSTTLFPRTPRAPRRCDAIGPRAPVAPPLFLFVHQSPRAAGEKRARATARAHVLKTRQLHIFILLKSAPADRLHPSLSPQRAAGEKRARASARAHVQDTAAPHFIVLRWYSGVSWARSGPWRLASRLASRRPRPVAVALRFASA